MKKIILLFFVSIITVACVKAQTYSTAIGAKFYTGNYSIGGLNIRHSLTENTAVEGSLLFYSGNVGIEGLYQYQAPINGVDGLQYFVGGGGMLGIGNETSFSLRLTGGVDYKFEDAPIDVSLGFDPFFQLAPNTSSSFKLGIGLRYVLK